MNEPLDLEEVNNYLKNDEYFNALQQAEKITQIRLIAGTDPKEGVLQYVSGDEVNLGLLLGSAMIKDIEEPYMKLALKFLRSFLDSGMDINDIVPDSD